MNYRIAMPTNFFLLTFSISSACFAYFGDYGESFAQQQFEANIKRGDNACKKKLPKDLNLTFEETLIDITEGRGLSTIAHYNRAIQVMDSILQKSGSRSKQLESLFSEAKKENSKISAKINDAIKKLDAAHSEIEWGCVNPSLRFYLAGVERRPLEPVERNYHYREYLEDLTHWQSNIEKAKASNADSHEWCTNYNKLTECHDAEYKEIYFENCVFLQNPSSSKIKGIDEVRKAFSCPADSAARLVAAKDWQKRADANYNEAHARAEKAQQDLFSLGDACLGETKIALDDEKGRAYALKEQMEQLKIARDYVKKEKTRAQEKAGAN